MDSSADRAHFEGSRIIIGDKEGAETYDARFLIATLLVHVAKGDGEISAIESDRMIDLLADKFAIRGPEALERLSAAIMALANDPDILRKMHSAGAGLSAEQKHEVLAMMLDVMAADNNLHSGEVEAVDMAGQVLGLSRDVVYSALRSRS